MLSRKYALTFLVILMIFYPKIQNILSAQQQMLNKEDNVHFRWAFGALTNKGNDHILIPITKDTSLKTGDQLKIFFELQKNCFVYLIYQSSQGLLDMLFPNDLQQFGQGYNILGKTNIPPGNQWFELDQHVGTETFYLLASAQRLNQLESLLLQYKSAQSNHKEELKQKILAEIKNLRWQHRNFKTHAERPVSIIGSLRGLGKVDKPEDYDVADHAIEISAQNFYSRTFTIDHRQ